MNMMVSSAARANSRRLRVVVTFYGAHRLGDERKKKRKKLTG